MAGHSGGGGIGEGYKRKTRSQFRPCSLSLTPFKSVNPAELEVNMDFSMHHSSSPHHLPPGYMSPMRGGKTIKEINKEIDELKKENFNLKLRLYLMERKMPKDFDHVSRETLEVNVQLEIETETLRNELKNRNKLLQEAVNAARHFETKVKDSNEKILQLEQQIASLTQETQHLPSISHSESDVDAYRKAFGIEASLSEKSLSDQESLTQIKLSFEKEIENLQSQLSAKDQQIEDTNVKLEELKNANNILEEKTRKKSIAIQGLVHKLKDHPDPESKELWFLLQSGVDAARSKDVHAVICSVEKIKTSLCELLSMSYSGLFGDTSAQELKDFENEIQMKNKLIENFEIELAQQNAKAQVNEEKIETSEKRTKELEAEITEKNSVVQNYIVKLQSINKEILSKDEELKELQDALCQKETELNQLQQTHQELLNEFHVTDSLDSLKEPEQKLNDKPALTNSISHISVIVEDNKKLLQDAASNSTKIEQLTSQCTELEDQVINLKSKLCEAISRVKELEKINEDKGKLEISTLKVTDTQIAKQNAVKPHSQALRTESLMDFGKSDSIDDLKEDVLVLILKIEDKEKKILTLKLQLQDALASKDTNVSQIILLQQHLEKLARFMEQLLQDQSRNVSLDSSYSPYFLNEISKCLEQSLILSHTISQNLTMCEDSKTFNPEESFALPDNTGTIHTISEIANDVHSYPSLSLENQNQTIFKDWVKEDHSEKGKSEGRRLHVISNQKCQENVSKTGKRRRWSYMVQHKPATQFRALNLDKVILHSTASSEDSLQSSNHKELPEEILHRCQQLKPNRGSSLSFVETADIGDGVKNNTYPYPISQNFHVQKTRQCWDILNKDEYFFYADVQEQNRTLNDGVHPFRDIEKQAGPWQEQCMSSDSDIWSEPDKVISLQRLGIDTKASFTSPNRKHQSAKDKRISEDFSTESSVSLHALSKKHSRRRQRCGFVAKASGSEYNEQVERRLSVVESQQNKVTAIMDKFENIGSQISALKGFRRSSLGELDDYERIAREINILKSALSEALLELRELKGTIKEDICAAHDSSSIKDIKEAVEKMLRTISEVDHSKDIAANETKDVAQKALSELDAIKKQLEQVNSVIFAKETDAEIISEQIPVQSDESNVNLTNVTQLKQSIEKEKAQNSQLRQDMIMLSADNDRLKEMLERLQQDLMSEQERLAALNREKTELHRRSQEIASESGDFKQRLEKEEERLKVLTAQRSELKDKLYEVTITNQNLIEANALLLHQKSCLEEEKVKYKADFSTVESICDQLDKELKDTKERLNQLMLKCSQYEKDLTCVSNERDDLILRKQTLQNTVLLQTAKIAELGKQYSEAKLLLSERDQLINENEQLEDAVNLQTTKLNELSKKYSIARTELREKDQLLIEKQQLEDAVKLHKSKISSLSKQCSDAKVQLSEKDQLLLEIQQLRDTGKSQTAKINELCKRNTDAKIKLSEKEQLHLEVEQLENTVKAQLSKINELSKQNSDIKKQMNENEQVFQEKQQLEGAVRIQSTKIAELRKQYSDAVLQLNEKGQLFNEKQQLEAKVSLQAAKITDLSKKYSDIKLQLNDKNKLLFDKQQLENTVSLQTAKISELTKCYSEANLQMKTLQAKGDSVNVAYEKLLLENNELNERIVDFKQQLQDKDSSLNKILSQEDALKHQILTLQNEVLLKESLIKQLQEQKENLVKERDALKVCVSEKESAIKNTVKDAAESKIKLITLQQSDTTLQQQLEKVKAVKDSIEKSQLHLTVELKEEHEKLVWLGSQISELLQQVVAEDQFSVGFIDKEQIIGGASQSMHFIENSKGHLLNINQHKDIKEIIKILKKKVTEIKQCILDRGTTIESLNEENKQLKAKVSEKEESLKKLETTLNIAKTDLSSKQSVIEVLQEKIKQLEVEKLNNEKEKLNIQQELIKMQQKGIRSKSFQSSEINATTNQFLLTGQLLDKDRSVLEEFENRVQIPHGKVSELPQLSSLNDQPHVPSIPHQQKSSICYLLNENGIQTDSLELNDHLKYENNCMKTEISSLLKVKDSVSKKVVELEEQLDQKNTSLKKVTDELRKSQVLLKQQQDAIESMRTDISSYANKFKSANSEHNLEAARSERATKENIAQKFFMSDQSIMKNDTNKSLHVLLSKQSRSFSVPDIRCLSVVGIENCTLPEQNTGAESNTINKLILQAETSSYLENKCLQQIDSFSNQEKIKQGFIKTSKFISEKSCNQSLGSETVLIPELGIKTNDDRMDFERNRKEIMKMLPQNFEFLQHKNGRMSESSSLESICESVSSFIDHFINDSANNVEAVQKLNAYKWNLQKHILNLQKEIFKSSPIHLERHINFIKHIINIHSQEVCTSLFKPQSDPLLHSSTKTSLKCVEKAEITDKNRLLNLQIDIECLQNIKMLLKYFVIPMAQQEHLSDFEEDDPSCMQRLNNSVEANEDSTHGIKVSSKEMLHEAEELSHLQKRMHRSKVSRAHKNDYDTHDVKAHKFENIESLRSRSKEFETLSCMEKSTNEKKLQGKIGDLIKQLGGAESVNRALKLELRTYEKIMKRQALSEGALMGKDAISLSFVLNLLCEIRNLREEMEFANQDNLLLKQEIRSSSLKSVKMQRKEDVSDQESALSADDTLTLSRSASFSQMSTDSNSMKTNDLQKSITDLGPTKERNPFHPISHRSESLNNLQESVFQRSNYSSPDLGIESDPNHDASAPEHLGKDDFFYSNHVNPKLISSAIPFKVENEFIHAFSKPLQVTDRGISWVYSPKTRESVSKGETLHAIGLLQEYELLKKEVEESVVGIKGISSRAKDCLKHLAKHAIQKKGLEYSTLKAILDSCNNVEVCLLQAQQIVGNFWFSTVPAVSGSGDWNSILQQNQELRDQLLKLTVQMKEQEVHFKDAVERLKYAQRKKDDMERDIAKQLVKTKKVLRKAKANLQGIVKDTVPGVQTKL